MDLRGKHRLENQAAIALVGLLSLSALSGPETAAAHDFAVTRVLGELSASRLDVTVELNQVDILDNILAGESGRKRFDSTAELRAERVRISDYVLSRLRVEARGVRLKGEIEADWPGASLPLLTTDSTGAAVPAAIPLRVSYAVPAGSAGLLLGFNLYAEGDFVPLFDVRLVRPGSTWERAEFLKAGATVTINPVSLPHPGDPTDLPGIEKESSSRSAFGRFVGLGFTHIIPLGLDHILFVLGLFLLAPGFRALLKLVTAFTVGHSITLALAMFEVVRLPSGIVEPAIALSIAVIAMENIVRRRMNRWHWAIVFTFGLVHGLGFAGVLGHLTLPSGQFVPALLGFNIGVELGQLAVIGLATALTFKAASRAWYPRYVIVPSSIVLGLVAIYWAVERIAG
jgi:hypothetical protein